MTEPTPGAEGSAGRGRGLSAAEVAGAVARGEVNDVPARSSRSTREIVRTNVLTRFNALIGGLFAVILVVGPIQDSFFGFIIVANTAIGIVQELRAKRTLDSLAVVGEARPRVRRDGESAEVHASDVVLGDLVELGPGDKVVVDGTIAEAEHLEIDESLLTGEADPVLKHPGDEVMSGSFVVAGRGAFTATKVGRQAYAAQLAEEAARFTLVDSELRNGIGRILKYVAWVMVPTAIGLIISQFTVGRHDVRGAVRRTVGGIVPIVPEGLVLLTSIAFAIGVIRLGRRNCLVQELPAIEGLARVDVVCLDKTGTLTEGGMSVNELRPVRGADLGYARGVLAALGAADPRPNASLRAIIAAYPPSDAGGWRPVAALPFSSARTFGGATLTGPGPGPGSDPGAGPGTGPGQGTDGSGSGTTTWLLGAPDVLLPAGHPLLAEVERLGADGLRVLLLAVAERDLDDERVASDLTPYALVVLEQRLRADAADTLRYFAEERIEVKVISGDNPVSVGAVAARLGLPGAEHPVDARELPAERRAMAAALEGGSVFGRVTPRQKREMVGALRAGGHLVAMTGDGVNDVLALKDADIGVAMGAGSEATRAVAQIVLLDNSFAALPSVVAEGRRVIGNITRVATLFLTKTVFSVLLALLVVFWQIPYPFLPRHLTLLSTLTIGIPAFFLALAPNTERARPRFVHRVLRYAVPSGVVCGVATFITYLTARHHYTGAGALGAEASAATLTLFLLEVWVLAIVARPYTFWRIVLLLAMGAGFLVVLATPWLQRYFALRLVGMELPWTAVGIAAVGAVALEIAWSWVRRHEPPDES
ncbi:HAD-IC family P-type ATPase [Streptomyces sp. NBC_01190]|uniref:HAD-IC family P-type ATPase n=1 Tax=Streptomyces sp. NBC_01190 TaxID=2903767 RepID=UPI0038697155|nr:cation-translocating P-type ATPase [Streptomyces sp. NBC_01190]